MRRSPSRWYGTVLGTHTTALAARVPSRSAGLQTSRARTARSWLYPVPGEITLAPDSVAPRGWARRTWIVPCDYRALRRNASEDRPRHFSLVEETLQVGRAVRARQADELVIPHLLAVDRPGHLVFWAGRREPRGDLRPSADLRGRPGNCQALSAPSRGARASPASHEHPRISQLVFFTGRRRSSPRRGWLAAEALDRELQLAGQPRQVLRRRQRQLPVEDADCPPRGSRRPREQRDSRSRPRDKLVQEAESRDHDRRLRGARALVPCWSHGARGPPSRPDTLQKRRENPQLRAARSIRDGFEKVSEGGRFREGARGRSHFTRPRVKRVMRSA